MSFALTLMCLWAFAGIRGLMLLHMNFPALDYTSAQASASIDKGVPWTPWFEAFEVDNVHIDWRLVRLIFDLRIWKWEQVFVTLKSKEPVV